MKLVYDGKNQAALVAILKFVQKRWCMSLGRCEAELMHLIHVMAPHPRTSTLIPEAFHPDIHMQDSARARREQRRRLALLSSLAKDSKDFLTRNAAVFMS
eukprot:6460870-Amphidinium_carterae.1